VWWPASQLSAGAFIVANCSQAGAIIWRTPKEFVEAIADAHKRTASPKITFSALLWVTVRMSAFGPKRTSACALHMSAFGGKADMREIRFRGRYWG